MKNFCIQIVIVFAILNIEGCDLYGTQTTAISDFSKTQHFDLKASDTSFVVNIRLCIKGYVEDTVRIGIGNGGVVVIGLIDTCQLTDWYSPKAQLTVHPVKPTMGKLEVSVSF